MDVKTKDIKDSLKNIKNSLINLEHVVENIRAYLEGSINIIKKYSVITENIIYKYEKYNKDLKNHRILKSVINLKDSNEKVIENIKSIINEKNIREQTKNIMDIFILDREDYINGSHNNNNDSKSSNGLTD